MHYTQVNNGVYHNFQAALSISALHLYPVSPDFNPISKVKVLCSSIAAAFPLTAALHSLLSQTGPLIRVRLLCSHVH